MEKSYLNNGTLPRGLRNNNPGNLVQTSITWLGKVPLSQNTDSRFEQFYELRYGIRALMRDIISDVKKGKTTVTGLITEFAPAFENNTTAYINSVIASVGSNIIGELTQEKLIALCKAIVLVENGAIVKQYIDDSDYQKALDILGITLKKKA
ncbi:structural protein [Flavobacterium sp. J27]|uniref:structural protein n=1 Tax=Flavobacterium sp. J27 TaxID=2060419 RepID=UPI00103199BA|nr:structural protein [Flavobacterium sp. J27]